MKAVEQVGRIGKDHPNHGAGPLLLDLHDEQGED